MNPIIGVTDFQRQFKRVFDTVVVDRVPYILTRGSRPEVVMLPYDQFLNYEKVNEAGVLKRFEAMLARMDAAQANIPDAELEADLKDATRTVRGTGA